jgi:hypothetical protein
MEKKQTAIDWLIEVLWAPCQGIPSDIIEQAKQMEKEQIIDSFRNGLDDFDDKDTFYYENGEKYYNETYRS